MRLKKQSIHHRMRIPAQIAELHVIYKSYSFSRRSI
jgi:hypothetical protein